MARSPRSSNGKASKQVDALKHDTASRKNIPTAEMESFFRRDEDSSPMPPKHYPRTRPLAEGEVRTPEAPSQPELIWNGARISVTDAQMKELAETGTLTLSDAQLVWRGKDRQDWTDLVVNVPPLYIQEKTHPKAIIDDLKRRTAEKREADSEAPDLFADFNGIAPAHRHRCRVARKAARRVGIGEPQGFFGTLPLVGMDQRHRRLGPDVARCLFDGPADGTQKPPRPQPAREAMAGISGCA
jgi:hypothetical protein